MAASSQTEARARLDRLQAHLQHDPGNRALLADAADAAFAAGDLAAAEGWIGHLRDGGALAPEQANLAALIAIARERFEEAVSLLSPLAADEEPGPRFNLAWALTLLGRHEEVVPLLSPGVIAAVPRAATLKVQALHHLGRLDEALLLGEALADERADDPRLMGALALLALDAEQPGLAAAYAARAAGGAQGRTALGMLALAENDAGAAAHHFDEALAAEAGSARAWLGRGLALLAQGRPADALPAVTRAAEAFGDHTGSWIAVGWLRFVTDDRPGARLAFERAAAIEPGFGEAHGGLAVLDLIGGDDDAARSRLAAAERLDRDALGVRLARYLMRRGAGDAVSADEIYREALGAAIGPNGSTLAVALGALATRRRDR